MKKTTTTVLLFLFLTKGFSQNSKQPIITTDVDNFWVAYDKITATKDTAQQYDLLNTWYFEKGTTGLKSIMEARNYTPQMYLDAIRQYPLFWQSIRPNTLQSKNIRQEIELAIHKLRRVYPGLKPVPIYFTIGVFRTNGTAKDNAILI